MHVKGRVADVLLCRAAVHLTAGGAAHAAYQLAVAPLPKKQDRLPFLLPVISWFNFIQLSLDQ